MNSLIKVCVIGGGLSGITTVKELLIPRTTGVNKFQITLIEARDDLGGRLQSHNGVDLGGTWTWPSDRYLRQLLDELEPSPLTLLPQHGAKHGYSIL